MSSAGFSSSGTPFKHFPVVPRAAGAIQNMLHMHWMCKNYCSSLRKISPTPFSPGQIFVLHCFITLNHDKKKSQQEVRNLTLILEID